MKIKKISDRGMFSTIEVSFTEVLDIKAALSEAMGYLASISIKDTDEGFRKMCTEMGNRYNEILDGFVELTDRMLKIND